MHSRNAEAEVLPFEPEISAGNAQGALIWTVEGSADGAGGVNFHVQHHFQRAKRSAIVACDAGLLLGRREHGNQGGHCDDCHKAGNDWAKARCGEQQRSIEHEVIHFLEKLPVESAGH